MSRRNGSGNTGSRFPLPQPRISGIPSREPEKDRVIGRLPSSRKTCTSARASSAASRSASYHLAISTSCVQEEVARIPPGVNRERPSRLMSRYPRTAPSLPPGTCEGGRVENDEVEPAPSPSTPAGHGRDSPPFLPTGPESVPGRVGGGGGDRLGGESTARTLRAARKGVDPERPGGTEPVEYGLPRASPGRSCGYPAGPGKTRLRARLHVHQETATVQGDGFPRRPPPGEPPFFPPVPRAFGRRPRTSRTEPGESISEGPRSPAAVPPFRP